MKYFPVHWTLLQRISYYVEVSKWKQQLLSEFNFRIAMSFISSISCYFVELDMFYMNVIQWDFLWSNMTWNYLLILPLLKKQRLIIFFLLCPYFMLRYWSTQVKAYLFCSYWKDNTKSISINPTYLSAAIIVNRKMCK